MNVVNSFAAMRALVVEDYRPMRDALAKALIDASFTVDVADNGQDGLSYAQQHEYELIILDLTIPQLDGLTLTRQLRGDGCRAEILILTSKGAVKECVEGLSCGADDYLIKPVTVENLIARIQVLLCRRRRRAKAFMTVGSLDINTVTNQVFRAGHPIALTRREYALLQFLASRPGETISRSDIWHNVYEFKSDARSNVIDVYIRYLRKKLERPDWPTLIHTRRGFGYSLFEQTSSE